jgi:rRNA maturation endonuclease Nob1
MIRVGRVVPSKNGRHPTVRRCARCGTQAKNPSAPVAVCEKCGARLPKLPPQEFGTWGVVLGP